MVATHLGQVTEMVDTSACLVEKDAQATPKHTDSQLPLFLVYW